MAHDSKREDYQRLCLRFSLSLNKADPLAATHAFATFGQRFAQDRDSLPQTDADRAFHLVSLATEAIDYQLPFADEKHAEQLIARGHNLLEEAVSLDPECYDAVRMLSSTQATSVLARYELLASRVEEVRQSCEEQRQKVMEALDDPTGTMGSSITMHPYWRWLASMAEEALICGRNHDAIDAAEKLLAEDPTDLSDVRFTLAYALAKLEDEKGLERLAERYAKLRPARPANDAWIWLARIALAHKRCDFKAARSALRSLIMTYRGAGAILIRQMELPDGEFARLRVIDYSEDELVLAVSEGIVLLQEGTDPRGKGVLGEWLAHEVERFDPKAAVRAAQMEAGEEAAQ